MAGRCSPNSYNSPNRLWDEIKDIFYASVNTRDCMYHVYGGFIYRVVIMLDNTRSAFSKFYYEYYGIPRNTSRSAKMDRIWYRKLRFDWSIQRSPVRPTQYNLVRCSYVEINIGILIRLLFCSKCVLSLSFLFDTMCLLAMTLQITCDCTAITSVFYIFLMPWECDPGVAVRTIVWFSLTAGVGGEKHHKFKQAPVPGQGAMTFMTETRFMTFCAPAPSDCPAEKPWQGFYSAYYKI